MIFSNDFWGITVENCPILILIDIVGPSRIWSDFSAGLYNVYGALTIFLWHCLGQKFWYHKIRMLYEFLHKCAISAIQQGHLSFSPSYERITLVSNTVWWKEKEGDKRKTQNVG